jgi:hypothetical protein
MNSQNDELHYTAKNLCWAVQRYHRFIPFELLHLSLKCNSTRSKMNLIKRYGQKLVGRIWPYSCTHEARSKHQLYQDIGML